MTPDDDDALAAEYVLGTLPDRDPVDRRVTTDPAFASLVRDWEQRLSHLNDEFAEAPAPNLLPAIEARLFGRSRRRWTWMGLGGLAAASLATFLIVAPLREDALITRLESEGQALVVETTFTPSSGAVRLVRVAGPVAPVGQSYEGWIIRPGDAPVSLGVLADAPLQVQATDVPEGTVIAITLEPEGGSPTGGPTGPVILNAPLNL